MHFFPFVFNGKLYDIYALHRLPLTTEDDDQLSLACLVNRQTKRCNDPCTHDLPKEEEREKYLLTIQMMRTNLEGRVTGLTKALEFTEEERLEFAAGTVQREHDWRLLLKYSYYAYMLYRLQGIQFAVVSKHFMQVSVMNWTIEWLSIYPEAFTDRNNYADLFRETKLETNEYGTYFVFAPELETWHTCPVAPEDIHLGNFYLPKFCREYYLREIKGMR